MDIEFTDEELGLGIKGILNSPKYHLMDINLPNDSGKQKERSREMRRKAIQYLVAEGIFKNEEHFNQQERSELFRRQAERHLAAMGLDPDSD